MFSVEHGEGCDDMNTVDDDACDNKCRKNVMSTNLTETEPNEDRFWATHVWPDTTNTAGAMRFVVSANHSVCDSDTFVVRLNVGESLHVRVKKSGGSAYYTLAEIMNDFTFTATTATGSSAHTPADDGSGNAEIFIPAVAATTEYFVNFASPLNAANDATRSYQVEFDVN